MEYYLGINLGTSGVKTILIDRKGGGMFNRQNSSPVIINCIFDGNLVDQPDPAWTNDSGGAIYNWDNWSGSAPTSVINSIFTNNQADEGGAIVNYNGWITITNCTITANTAIYRGGALFNTFGGTPTIKNTIMYGNFAPVNPEIKDFSPNLVITFSDIQGLNLGFTNIDADPLFIGSGDLHLQAGSPAIDAGTAAGAPSTDLDGNPRPDPTSGLVDIGAYEF